jgi:hypothetical protein
MIFVRRRHPPHYVRVRLKADGVRGYNFAAMCGRYTLVNLAQLTDLFPWITEMPQPIAPRYNIAPSQPILAVANDHADRYDHFLWGLIPSWAKDPKIGQQLCNARAETIAEKNSFKNAYRRRRCVIPGRRFLRVADQRGRENEAAVLHPTQGRPAVPVRRVVGDLVRRRGQRGALPRRSSRRGRTS